MEVSRQTVGFFMAGSAPSPSRSWQDDGRQNDENPQHDYATYDFATGHRSKSPHRLFGHKVG
jgi:hypothetical protein